MTGTKRVNPAPLLPGGSNFASMRLCFPEDQRIVRIKPSRESYFFGSIIGIIGIALLLPAFFLCRLPGLSSPVSFVTVLWFLFSCVFLFFGFRIIMAIRKRCRSYFDLSVRTFYPAGREPQGLRPQDFPAVSFSEFAFLQVVTESCRGAKNSHFYSYELNLVLRDNTRYNLLDHGSKECFVEDAEKLAAVLSLPLTDAEGKPFNPDAFLNLAAEIRNNLLLGFAALVVLAVSLYFGAGAAWYRTKQSLRWEKTPAVVTGVQVPKHTGSKGRKYYTLDFHYRYRFRGKEYNGDCYSFFSRQKSPQSGWDRTLRRYPVGKEIACYVDPASPARTVVSRKIPPWWTLLPQSLWSIIPLLAALCLLLKAWNKYRCLKQRRGQRSDK